MPFIRYTDSSTSDVEYESVKFNDLTSCYTYNPLYTAISVNKIDEKDENNFMQWIVPNEVVKFSKSDYDGYLDIIWIKDRPAYGGSEGTSIIPVDGTIDVITTMDLKKYRFVIDKIVTTLTDDGIAITSYDRDAQTYTELLENERIDGCSFYWENIENGKRLETISPVIRYVDENGEQLLFYPHIITSITSFSTRQSNGQTLSARVAHSSTNTIYLSLLDIDKKYNYPGIGTQYNTTDDDTDIAYMWYNQNQSQTVIYPTVSYEKFLEALALLGVYFRIGGVDYLGFMDESGQTTGEYLTAENWSKSAQYESTSINNFKEHNPPYVPEPDDDYPDDKSDNIPFGGAYAGLGAFAKFYLCSGLTIAGLSTWINGRDPDWPEGFDPMSQIIGLSRFATDLSSASYGSTTIKFHTADGTTIDTRLAALHGNGDNIELDLGSVDIPLRMYDRGVPFLDYSSTVELYIPACGTFQLDPQTILGSTLSVKMWLSTATGECSAIAYVNRGGANNPVAYGSGSLAVPMPISSNGWGAYQAALTNASIKQHFGSLQVAPSIIQSLTGILNDDYLKSSSGVTSMIGTLQNVAQADTERQHVKNSSYTSVSGSFGSTAAWNYPFNAYIKITRPRYRKPENYGHTQGIPLVATKTLSECSGYTVCVGTDVSSINATINEKNQIISLLSSGVIV